MGTPKDELPVGWRGGGWALGSPAEFTLTGLGPSLLLWKVAVGALVRPVTPLGREGATWENAGRH